MSVGLLYFEIELDTTKFVKQQNDLNAKIKNLAQDTDKSLQLSYQNLGVKADAYYQLQANLAIKSYERINRAAKQSADEQVRAQSAMVAKINSINQQMTANPLYETLGIKSQAAYKAQEAAIIASYDTIKKSSMATSEDLVRIERAKNEKLKQLNKEMVGDHEMSMASMTRAVLRFYAAYYVISQAIQVIGGLFMGGIKAIDDMKVSTIGVAAQITTMQGITGDIAKNYKENLQYAEALIPVLQQVDVNSFANLSQIQKMNMAMSMQGSILDVNNQKQIESFTALTNAVALFTQGQDKEKQASQEIRALFSGQVREGNMVALMIDQQIKKTGEYKDGLKGLVEEGRKYGNTLELLTPYLTGIIAASGDIQSTWAAVSSSIETTWNIMQRGLFKDTYKSLVESGQVATAWLKANQDEVVQYIKIAWGFIADAFTAAWNVLKGFVPIMKDMASLLAPIAYGWGGVLAALKPIGESIGNSIAMVYALGKAIVSTAMAASRLAIFDFEGAKLYWDEAKKGYSDVWKLQKKNFDLVTTGVADSIVAYDKQYNAAKKAAQAKVTSPDIPLGAGTDAEKKKAEDYAKYMEQVREKAYLKEMELFDEAEKSNAKYLKDKEKDEVKLREKSYIEEMERFDALEESNAKYLEDYKKKQIDAAEEYRKIMMSVDSFSTDSHQKAMNRIIDMEKEKYRIIENLQNKGLISAEQAEKAKEKIIKNTAAETKKLNSDTFFQENSERQSAFSSMAQNFDAMGQLYVKDSRERQALSDMSKAATIAEIALQVQKNLMIAVGAVVNQGTGDPYSAFARIAAMIAVVSGVLAMGGIAFGGGGSGASVLSGPAFGQNTTVLGGANDQGSESISKSWELMQDTYDMEYRELSGIYNQMKDLNQNITGLVTTVVRNRLSFTPMETTSVVNEFSPMLSSISRNGSIFADKIFAYMDQLFWGTTTTQQMGIGVQAGAGPIRTIAEQWPGTVQANQWQTWKTENSGGWLGDSSTTIGGSQSETTDDIKLMFKNLYENFAGTFIELGSGLGADMEKLYSYTFSNIVVDFLGKTAEEINTAFTEEISRVTDIAAFDLFGDIVGQYQKIGEGLLETATRLITDKAVILDTMEMTGQAFVGTAQEAIALSESLINLAGDLDTLRENAEKYYDKFYSDAEKQVRLQQQLVEAFTDMNLVLPETRSGYRSLLESLTLDDSGQYMYVRMLELAESADEYYTALGDVLDAQNDLIASLKNQRDTIKQWLIDISMSNLSPAVSAESYANEYSRQRSIAFAGDASEDAISSYLNYAKTYLEFMRTYSGDYQNVYSSVINDVSTLGDRVDLQLDIAQRQLDALKNIELYTATSAAMAAASAVAATDPISQLYQLILGRSADTSGYQYYSALYGSGTTLSSIAASMYASSEYTGHASGGYSSVPAIFGEAGGEWAVPTYEPQRTNFLKKAPSAFWENLGLNGGSNGPGGEMVVHVHVNVDGKEIGDVVTKQIPRNGDLAGAIRRIVN